MWEAQGPQGQAVHWKRGELLGEWQHQLVDGSNDGELMLASIKQQKCQMSNVAMLQCVRGGGPVCLCPLCSDCWVPVSVPVQCCIGSLHN